MGNPPRAIPEIHIRRIRRNRLIPSDEWHPGTSGRIHTGRAAVLPPHHAHISRWHETPPRLLPTFLQRPDTMPHRSCRDSPPRHRSRPWAKKRLSRPWNERHSQTVPHCRETRPFFRLQTLQRRSRFRIIVPGSECLIDPEAPAYMLSRDCMRQGQFPLLPLHVSAQSLE